jgi:UDP-N-acetylmuramate: L-alanyl-gamma-D-glutamyl-meso-diaminopimelate ligase
MHIHILGICGTFMGGLAALAREAGHTVTGCDAGVYPPMSDQLRALGIELIEGFDASQMALKPDVFVIGNVVSRARKPDGTPKFPLMEAILDAGAPYTSGPQWLAEHVLQGRHVLAVAGTHGKTTTTSMLAWILEAAGLQPGFLVGGVPVNFGVSARLGGGTAAGSCAGQGGARAAGGGHGAEPRRRPTARSSSSKPTNTTPPSSTSAASSSTTARARPS